MTQDPHTVPPTCGQLAPCLPMKVVCVVDATNKRHKLRPVVTAGQRCCNPGVHRPPHNNDAIIGIQ